jgi:hypothetical protein
MARRGIVPRFSFVAIARSSRAFSCDFRFLSSVSGTRMSFCVGTLLRGVSSWPLNAVVKDRDVHLRLGRHVESCSVVRQEENEKLAKF